MGCDEHMYVERLRKGVWVPVDPPDCMGWNKWMHETPELAQLSQALEDDSYPLVANLWNFGRYYRAYGYLAGVIAEDLMWKKPEGIPHDASDMVKQSSDSWDVDGHSHTFYTLKDLENHLRPVGKKNNEGLDRIRQLVGLMKKVAKTYKLDHDSVRMIVWFDN